MHTSELLEELFTRVDEHVENTLDGLHADDLTVIPEPASNSIGWLLWHLIRVQDHHVSAVLEEPQVWTTGDWSSRFGLEPDPHNTGYGHSADDVGAVRPDGPDALTDYCSAVTSRTRTFLAGLDEAALDRVVDERWDPPVTLGVRLVSVADDDIQHAGQAAYVRGLLRRR
jgi:uncharacterized damage-inducible protein DinB